MPLNADRKATILFSCVLAAGILALLAWFALSASEYTTYEIRTHDTVSGLIADAPIEFHGVDVGKVRQVELIDPHSVRILLSIRNTAPVSTATIATITSRGLATRGFTGYVYVSLENDGGDAHPIPAPRDGGYRAIPTAPSRTVNLDMAIDQVNRNVEAITQQLQETLDEKTIVALKQSVQSLQRVSQALETQILPGANRTLTRLDDLSTSMSGVASKLNHDPAALLHGAPRRAPGPGEGK
jgi:phospholipid/cholesterol/gamma-HCH transport system substrate-binding protein